MNARKLVTVLSVILLSCGLMAAALVEAPLAGKLQRTALQKMVLNGNYKDAYEGFRKLALDPNDDPRQVGDDLTLATQCLQHLGRVDEIDDFREAVIKAHTDNWRLLLAAADNYLNIAHHGFIVAGKFDRGNKRGGGRMVNAAERDRVRALQLMVQALPLAAKDDNHARGRPISTWPSPAMLMNNRGYAEAWRLQYLTDLAQLPDYDDGWYYGRQTTGAPVDADGNPVFHTAPKRFEDAANRRPALAVVPAAGRRDVDPSCANEVRWLQFADFLQQPVRRADDGPLRLALRPAWRPTTPRKTRAAPTPCTRLGEDETIARLATGIKRFKLPDEFNYIKIYQQIAAEPQDRLRRRRRWTQLARSSRTAGSIRKAADYLAAGHQGVRPRRTTTSAQAAAATRSSATGAASSRSRPSRPGKGATVEYRFRNGTAGRLRRPTRSRSTSCWTT